MRLDVLAPAAAGALRRRRVGRRREAVSEEAALRVGAESESEFLLFDLG